MSRIIAYLRTNFTDAGTIRSLAVLILSMKYTYDAQTMADALTGASLAAVTGFSTLKPPAPKPAVVIVEQAPQS